MRKSGAGWSCSGGVEDDAEVDEEEVLEVLEEAEEIVDAEDFERAEEADFEDAVEEWETSLGGDVLPLLPLLAGAGPLRRPII